MVRLKNFREHRLWEDWLTVGLGVLIGLTPWLAGETDSETIILHTGLIGALVLALGAFEFVQLRRWEELLQLALGLWLIAAPFALGYADGGLAIWHYVLGAIVALLAAFELWQDWKLDPAEMAKHGQ